MLYIVQTVLSGIAEVPKIFSNESRAQAAFVECAREYWAQSYPAYCSLQGLDPDSYASAQAFIRSFDYLDKNRIHCWTAEPEDAELDNRQHVLPCAEPVAEGSGLLLPPAQPEEPDTAAEKYTAPEWKTYVSYIKNMCSGIRNEFHLFTRHDWRQAVYSNETPFDYWEWLAARVDSCSEKAKKAGYTVLEDSQYPGQFTFKTPQGVISEISSDSEIEAWCRAGLHLEE